MGAKMGTRRISAQRCYSNVQIRRPGNGKQAESADRAPGNRTSLNPWTEQQEAAAVDDQATENVCVARKEQAPRGEVGNAEHRPGGPGEHAGKSHVKSVENVISLREC